MASQISEKDRKRGYMVTAIAIFCTGIFICIFPLSYYATLSFTNLGYIIPIIATGKISQHFWYRLITEGETKSRGIHYGALTGLCCMVATALFYVSAYTILAILEREGDTVMGVLIDFSPFLLVGAIIFCLVMSFIVIPIGAITGYFFTKNPDQSVPPNSGQ